MPQESFALSFGYPDELVQGVRTLVSRIADPTPDTIVSLTREVATDAANASSAAQGMRSDFSAATAPDGTLGKAATDAANASTAAQGMRSDFSAATAPDGIIAKAADNAQETWNKVGPIDFATFATTADINRVSTSIADVRSDIAALQSLVWCLWLLDHKWCSHRTYAEMTAEQFLRACEPHGMPHLPSQDQIGDWMRTARTSAVAPPRPPASPSRRER